MPKGKRQTWRDTFGEQIGAPKNVVVDGLELRFCTKCVLFKPLELFSLGNKGKHYRWCRDCKSENDGNNRLKKGLLCACGEPLTVTLTGQLRKTCGSASCQKALLEFRPFRPLPESKDT